MLPNAPLIIARVVLAAAFNAGVECPALLAETLARAEGGNPADPDHVIWKYLRTEPPEPLRSIGHAVSFAISTCLPTTPELSLRERASMAAASARVALVALGWTEDAARAALDRAVTTGELPTPKARA